MSESTTRVDDVLSAILGVAPGSKIDRLRMDRPNQIDELQAYYDAIFDPTAVSAANLPAADRFALAIRVASHTGSQTVARWYATRASEHSVPDVLIERLMITQGHWNGDTAFDAAVRHVDLVTLSPVEARPEDLAALKAVGYSPAAVVSLSQVIAFVAYQVRLVAGLRALDGLE